jgi:hypothetical protein
MINNTDKKSILNNVNQKHVLPPQDRQEHMSMADRDQAEVLERLLSAGNLCIHICICVYVYIYINNLCIYMYIFIVSSPQQSK